MWLMPNNNNKAILYHFKSIYLSIIQDKAYEHIKDQACCEKAPTYQEVQSSTLR